MYKKHTNTSFIIKFKLYSYICDGFFRHKNQLNKYRGYKSCGFYFHLEKSLHMEIHSIESHIKHSILLEFTNNLMLLAITSSMYI